MKGYLFVADESGREIEGSRRYLHRCENNEDVARIKRELEQQAGNGCSVLDSEVDRLHA